MGWTCVLIGAPGERPSKEIRTFRTMTRDLEALRDWAQELGVTQVGMESTGVYWRPVDAVLEGRFDLIVGNARHIRNVPGRKTDVKDAEWIADLVRHGRMAKSFVPPAPQRELRELLRYRRVQHALLMQIPGVDWVVRRRPDRRDRRRHERLPQRLPSRRMGQRVSRQP